jgi:hypothetical protein
MVLKFVKKYVNHEEEYKTRLGRSRNALRAEIDMNLWNQLRYHNIQTRIDEFAFQCHCLNSSSVRPYYGALFLLFRNIQKLMFWKSAHAYKRYFEEVRDKIESWEQNVSKRNSFPREIADDLDKIHADIMLTMQALNLGDKAFNPRTTEELLKDAIV